MMRLASLVVFVLVAHQYCDGRRPYVDHPTCPRRQNTTESGRPCLRKCHDQHDCRATNRKCVCYGACGMTCVKLRKNKKRCRPAADVVNGNWEPVTSSPSSSGRHGYRVGSVIRYSCDEGFTLYGPVERRCVANGSWSDATPACVPITEISGAWSSASTKRCPKPPVVAYGRHNASAGRRSFPLGTRLVYRCRRGYSMAGSFRVICVDEGRWTRPQITCTPIACKKLSAPEHGQILSEDDISRFGSNVTFTCDRGYELSGSVTRTCLPNGTWDGSPALCKRMHCVRPSPFPHGYIDGDKNPMVGSVIEFRCQRGMLFEGEHDNTCRPDGTWSKPIPKCWRPCVLPPVVNGSILQPADAAVGTTVDHGSTLQYECREGFHPGPATTTCCHNGTWLTMPLCSPAPCKGRPKKLTDGIVRYHRQEHGDHALYECNFGFSMVGSNYALCQYGEWTNPSGDERKCKPNRCDYPGNITNGRVLLVGHMGKYEYRRYVQPVSHNDHIQFECDKHFRLVGASGSTCVNGQWSPPQLPVCRSRRHRHLYYVRHPNDRSVGTLRRASLQSPRRRPFWATV